MIFEEGHLRVSLEFDSLEGRFDPVAQARAEAPGIAGSDQSTRRALVEVHRRVGGNPQRALLGGRKTCSASGSLTLRVDLSGRSETGAGQRCSGAFGRELSPGIPSEFAASVLRGLLSVKSCAGVVEVDRGAFDAVESSGAAFELAATILAVALEYDSTEVVEAVRRKVHQLVARV